ncbi:NADPH:quinone reductase [soil metagenome]
MLAAWYDEQGTATSVLKIGHQPGPEPGDDDVRVRIQLSGISPGDTKKRAGWLASSMAFPRIIPHSDGAGVIDAVGSMVDPARIGQAVWVYGAQSYRPFGTAAQFTVVPDDQAIALSPGVTAETGACLGIPGITAHRAVFADGPVRDTYVLVHGVAGTVGSIAAQLAGWGGAAVIGTVRRKADVAKVDIPALTAVIALDTADPVTAIRRVAPDGVDRIVEVALSDNADLDADVIANDAVIATYASREDRTALPFWPLLFNNATIRLLGSDDFPREAKGHAARDLAAAAAAGSLSVEVGDVVDLADIAAAHDRVDGRNIGRTLLALP